MYTHELNVQDGQWYEAGTRLPVSPEHTVVMRNRVIICSPSKFYTAVVFTGGTSADVAEVPRSTETEAYLSHVQGTQMEHYVVIPRVPILFQCHRFGQGDIVDVVELTLPMMYIVNGASVILRRIILGGAFTRYVAWSFDMPFDVSTMAPGLSRNDIVVLKNIAHLLVHFDVPDPLCSLIRMLDKRHPEAAFQLCASFLIRAAEYIPIDETLGCQVMNDGRWRTSLRIPMTGTPQYHVRVLGAPSPFVNDSAEVVEYSFCIRGSPTFPSLATPQATSDGLVLAEFIDYDRGSFPLPEFDSVQVE
jgi:hypothetical protein